MKVSSLLLDDASSPAPAPAAPLEPEDLDSAVSADPFHSQREGKLVVGPGLLLDPAAAQRHPKYAIINYKKGGLDGVDDSKPGSLVAGEKKNWSLELPGQNDAVHRFKAEEMGKPKKDIECVLFYDPVTNTYFIEPVYVNLRAKKQSRKTKDKAATGADDSSAAAPTTSSASASPADEFDVSAAEEADDYANDLDEALDEAFAEDEDEPPPPVADAVDDGDLMRELDNEMRAIDAEDASANHDDSLMRELDEEMSAIDMDDEAAAAATTGVMDADVHAEVDAAFDEFEAEAAFVEDGNAATAGGHHQNGEISETLLDTALDEAFEEDLDAPPPPPPPQAAARAEPKKKPMSLSAKYDGEDSESGSGTSSSDSDSGSSSGSDSDDD
ncbi:hypothetical protein HDU96_005996 [Phlyctochytrium bullatum]|nr:hypothetical protein HDU96_005996 [Phlyctochytrium bullatum]